MKNTQADRDRFSLPLLLKQGLVGVVCTLPHLDQGSRRTTRYYPHAQGSHRRKRATSHSTSIHLLVRAQTVESRLARFGLGGTLKGGVPVSRNDS